MTGRGIRPLLLSLLTLLAAGARAQGEERPAPSSWAGEVDGTVAYALRGNANGSTTPTVGVGFGGALYLRPLWDDLTVPLSLLDFFERPGLLSVHAVGTNTSPPGSFATQRYGLNLGVTVFPWAATGLTASADLGLSSYGGFGEGQFFVGFEHYFWREALLVAGYGFERGRAELLRMRDPVAGVPYLQAWAADDGRVAMTFLVDGTLLELQPALRFGWVRGAYGLFDPAVPAAPGALVVDGPLWGASLAATLHLGRHLDLSATGGINGHREGMAGGASVSSVVFGRAALQLWVTRAVFLRFGYELDIDTRSVEAQLGGGVLVTSTSALVHTLSFQLGARL